MSVFKKFSIVRDRNQNMKSVRIRVAIFNLTYSVTRDIQLLLDELEESRVSSRGTSSPILRPSKMGARR